jgi:uncharacterized membrane protein YhaH (DUF805 family)
MNFSQAIRSGVKNYVSCSGRATRSEYWYCALFLFLGGFISITLDKIVLHVPVSASLDQSHPFHAIFFWCTALPGITLAMRRLHDIDRSGWWILIALIPVVGFVILLVFSCPKGTEGNNRFGPDPLAKESGT